MGDMVKGNNAIAEAAVRAGAEIYAGYPITPSTETMEYLSGRMPELGRTFIQAESELAGINIILGASACGHRVFTASSGPGISLKQEGISYLNQNSFPAVILNVVRWGNGLGALNGSQTDYHRETRGGGNGDYRNIILCPSTVQEAVDLTYEAFDIADKYRCIVEIMTESGLGQMMEPCEYPEFRELKKADWGLDGTYKKKRGDFLGRDLKKESEDYMSKVREMRANEQRWEEKYTDDAEYIFVAFGLPGRAVQGLVEEMRSEGEKVGYVRPITAWPYPEKAFERIASVSSGLKGFITVETNGEGMMVDDVAIYAKKYGMGSVPVYALPYVCDIPKDDDVRRDFGKIRSGEIKEVY
jgi:2-oxoglutarate ferredoxin oxidoreductase subunit alpha